MVLYLLLGLAAWIGTAVITEAEIFRDVRDACDKLHDKHDNWWTYKLRYLVHCPMCTGIWVSGIIALFVTPLVSVPFVGWGLTTLAIKGIGHSFFILQKYFEAITDRQKAEAAYTEHDLKQRETWISKNVHDVDLPSADSH